MKTTAQLRNRVAEDLGLKAADIDLADEDAVKIEARIASVTAFLREKGLIWWDDDQIPDAVEDGFAMMVAAMACKSFGKQNQGFEAGWEDGRAMIASIKPAETIETSVTVYY